MEQFVINRENLDFKAKAKFKFRAELGLSEELVRKISEYKKEPEWMLKKRLEGLEYFKKIPVPTWGPDLSKLDFDKITYFGVSEGKENAKSWDEVPEDIKKTFERLGIPQAEREFLGGVGAQFECLSEDTPIFTNPKGPVKIKDIKVEDYVFSFDEKENKIKRAKVLGVKPQGKNQVYEVLVDNKRIKATANHPFLVLSHYKKEGARRGRYRREWRFLKDLKKGDLVGIAKKFPHKGKPYRLNHPVIKKEVMGKNQFGARYKLDVSHSYNKVVLPKETSSDLMWFFGLYLGDGYIKRTKGKDKKLVYIAIPETQPELRRELKKVVKELFSYDIKSEEEYRVSIFSTIVADFIELNGFKGGANEKRVPKWILELPKEQRLSFLAGYVDSDGYATHEKKHHILVFRSSNEKLIGDLRNLLLYCELHPTSIHLVKSRYCLDKDRIMLCYQIEITGDLKRIKSRYPPKAIRLNSRKGYLTYSTASGTNFRKHTNEHLGFARIKSIKPIGIENIYDIEVEGYHNFVANGLIVHNSTVAYHSIKKELEDKGVIFENMDVALREYPELVKKYFMTKCVPVKDHKFAALHAAVWSGGTFIHIPENVKVDLPLQAYFRMNAEGMGQFEHTLIIADKNSEVHYIEGCFTEGTLITTNPSYKPIENIKVGDKVLTHTGEYKRVYKVYDRPLYNGDIYDIKIWGDSIDSIECTEDHPFLVVRRKRANERNKTWIANWISAKYINNRDYLLFPINRKVVSNEFMDFEILYKGEKEIKNIKLDKDFFRLIGYYLAKGSISSGYYLNFSFGVNERIYIEDVKRLLKKLGVKKILEFKHKTNNGISVVVSDVRLARIFKQFGTSASEKSLPLWALFEDPEKQKELIIGLFRGDGNYFNVRYEAGLKEIIRLNTTSLKLAKQVRDILLRLNIFAFLNGRDRKKEGRQTMYTVGVTGEYMNLLGGLLGIKVADELNGKKRATMFYIDDNYAYVPVRNITKEEVKGAKVYNFAVEEDESYTVNSVVAHNCSAPQYNSNSIHAGCVELYALEGARIRYSSIENWSKNTYNLNTKRALVYKNARADWINGNMGCLTGDSKVFLNPKGPVNIKDIEAGDKVYAWDEKTNSIRRVVVKAKIFSGYKRVYKLQAGSREIQATANHPFLTIGKEWKSLEELKVGDSVGIVKDLEIKEDDKIYFAKINKIEEVGIKPTFDIEVEGYHNFVANGLIVHNSGVTMLYPCSILLEEGASSDSIGIAYAGKGQNQDTGSKVIHLAANTSSTIKAKSISKDGGITTYRGLLKVAKGAKNVKSNVQCDALMLDDKSRSDTIPYIEIKESKVDIGHEATAGRISEEKLFYLMSRGLKAEEAMKMIVSGFIEPVSRQLPGEYAVELNRLIELEMEGSVG